MWRKLIHKHTIH